MWDILLKKKQNSQPGAFRCQRRYGFRRNTWEHEGKKFIIHGVSVDISEDRMGAFFSKYGQVEEVSTVVSKSDIATGDFVIQVTLTHQSFGEIANVLMCREKSMRVVMDERRPYCWSCGSSGYMAKQPSTTTTAAQAGTTASVVASPEKAPEEALDGRQQARSLLTSIDAPQAKQPQPSPQERPREAQQQQQQQQKPPQKKQEQKKNRSSNNKKITKTTVQEGTRNGDESGSNASTRSSSLKRTREEEEEETAPAEKCSGRSRAERCMDEARSLFLPAQPKESVGVAQKASSLPQSPNRVPFSPPCTPSFSSASAHNPPIHFFATTPGQGKNEKEIFPGSDQICKVNMKELEKNLATQKKALLGLLFKMTKVDGKSMEDPRNFSKIPGVLTSIRDTFNLKVWNKLFEAKDLFPEI